MHSLTCKLAWLVLVPLTGAAQDAGSVMDKVKRKPADAAWKEYPARTVERVAGFTPREVPRTKFGGRADHTAKATADFLGGN